MLIVLNAQWIITFVKDAFFPWVLTSKANVYNVFSNIVIALLTSINVSDVFSTRKKS